jgi:AraC-like DNA-binding protein
LAAIDRFPKNFGAPCRHMASDALVMSRWKNTDPEVDVTLGGGRYVILLLSQTQTIEMRRGGPPATVRAKIGLISVLNPGTETTATIRGGSDTVHFAIPDGSADRAVRYRFVEPEPTIARLATRAAAMLHAGYDDPLALGELRLGFDAALEDGSNSQVARGGLSRLQLCRTLEAINAAIGSGVARSPSLAELAEAAGVSRFHFAHQFRHSVGESPYAYSVRQRIERARTILVETEELTSTIGFRCGFASPAHFVQRFREVIGVAPGRYRAIVRG